MGEAIALSINSDAAPGAMESLVLPLEFASLEPTSPVYSFFGSSIFTT